MKKFSLAMVAEKLGLSKTLVSLVLNGKGDANKISQRTQKKVIALAKKLNYQPNRFARSLRTGKTHIVGLIVPDISNAFFSLIAKTVEDEISKNGYHLIVCSTNEEEKKETNLIETLLNWNIDGIIIASTMRSTKMFEAIKKSRKPLVLMDRIFQDKKFLSVSVENKSGSELMVKHLIDKKRKNILLLTISPSHISPMKERRDGFVEACKKYKNSISTFKIIEIPFETMLDEVKKITQDIFLKKITVDAIFTANNTLALAVHTCMKELKIREDVTLCSFDDIPIFEHCSPPIAAIAQPVERIGREATKLLLQNIENRKLNETRIQLPVNLIIR